VRVRLAALVTALLSLVAWAAHAAAPPRVLVVLSADEDHYDEALWGLQETIRARYPEARVDAFGLGRAPFDDQPDLVCPLGIAAAQETAREAADLPVVAGLVLRPDVLADHPHATGVVLQDSIESQLEQLERVLPGARTIGVVYAPKENQARVDRALALAAHSGLRIEARPVSSPSEIPAALASLADRIDVLLGLPDSLVYTPETARSILLFSFRSRIPLVGLSGSWVQSGALYGPDWDYAELGRETGELALEVLDGSPPETRPPRPPQNVYYAVNGKTARRMKLALPPEVLRKATHVW